jgi:hypothetical protein
MNGVPIRIDRRTFFKDLYEVPEIIQDEAIRLLRFLECKGPDHPDLPIFESKGSVYLCACTETHYLEWVTEREKAPVESLFAFNAKQVLVTHLKRRP